MMMLAVPVTDADAFGGDFGGGPGGGPPGGTKPNNLWGDLEFTPVVGQWAEYRMDTKDDETMTMRISIVGKEDEAYWYETQMTGPDGRTMINKMLVAGDPEDMGNVKRMIMKPAGEQAIEMPVQMLNVMDGMGMAGMEAEEEEVPEPVKEDLGVESVTVPAGTFKAHHWRFTSGADVFEAWVREDVGPYGVVRSVANGAEMVLVAHGDKAVSQITEEPRKLPMGGGMGSMRGE
jgi:hypothetical protein